MKLKTLLFILTGIFWVGQLNAQSDDDAFAIKKIIETAMTESKAYDWLRYLTTKIGARLSGTPQSMAAIEYTRQMLDTLGLDSVWLQPCLVPHWQRGEPEICRIVNSELLGTYDLHVLALGGSVGTGDAGVLAEVVEVKSLDEVAQLGRKGIEGKIVFFNRPMDPTQINTFAAYGGAVDQRVYGAAVAANYGAKAAIIRSMTVNHDDLPHTGVMTYGRLQEGVEPIAGVAISTNDADRLSKLLAREGRVKVFIRTTSQNLEKKPSFNVIGEITGSEFPNEIILVGGHLDSWDVGQGAHDDGTGCVQAMAVLQLMKKTGYRPKRTIRCVLFMNEENGQAGSDAYAEVSNARKEYHLAALESDSGGFTPRGFSAEGDETTFPEKFKAFMAWSELFRPYGMDLKKGGSGADISRLKSQKGLLIGFLPDTQRYFDYHHTAADTFEAVNERELNLGVGMMGALVYLIDQHGL